MRIGIDKRFCYATLVSFIVHGAVIALWPRMRPPQPLIPLSFARVRLIEASPRPVNIRNKDIDAKPSLDKPPVADKKKVPEKSSLRMGKKVIEDIVEGLGQAPLEDRADKIVPPRINLPKQVITAEQDQYVEVWPEELAGSSSGAEAGELAAPMRELGHKGHPPEAGFAGIDTTLFKDEFPQERLSQQPQPEIVWKGKPRRWLTRPEETPSYTGDEEGLVRIRFWVNEHGEVINAIPIKKLSAGLEKKALSYIFSYRFEPLTGSGMQEGEIGINFKIY